LSYLVDFSLATPTFLSFYFDGPLGPSFEFFSETMLSIIFIFFIVIFVL